MNPKTNDKHTAFARKRVVRLRTLTLFLTAFMAVIAARLFYIQVISHDRYQSMARQQYERKVALEAERGIIFDRNGNKLAVNLMNYSFAADPNFMSEKDKDRVAENFMSAFPKSGTNYRKLLGKKTSFVWLERRVDAAQASKILDSVPGLIRLQSLRRYYPYGKSAAAIVGVTDIDNQGVGGIELSQDEKLAGINGWSILQADARGRLIPNPEYPHQEPVNGKNIILTVDANYQVIALQELERSIREYEADEGMVIILAPKTGEILAMVHSPVQDPNSREQFSLATLRNRVITDLYEPGSTFKAFSAVAAIEENIVTPDEPIFCENGKIKVYNHTIHDSKKHGMLTFTQVVEQSSNIGIIKAAQKLGADKLYQYARAFGFGNETGIDLVGEVKGTLRHPKDWSGLSLPMISIGQEIGVTALQMINAYAAIANGGALNKPYIIRAVTDPLTQLTEEREPQTIRTIASASTMAKVSRMLQQVVVSGTGRRVQISGVDIAGKTGTAQRVQHGQKGYAKGEYNASFVGYFPAHDPQLTFLVIVNNPRKSIWGETSAALTARAIIEKILNTDDDFARTINRVIAEADTAGWKNTGKDPSLPDVRYMTVDAARSLLDDLDIAYQMKGAGDLVVDQQWTYNAKKEKILILTYGKQYSAIDPGLADNKSVRVPDVRGLSMRRAVNELYQTGIEVKIRGNGFVIAQSPAAGSRVQTGAACVIQCRVD